MYYYKAFDKLLKSVVPLEGFIPASPGKPDVSINRLALFPETDPHPDTLEIRRIPDGYEFFPPYGTRYTVKNGNIVELISCSSTHPDLEKIPFYGYIPASLLQQKGLLVLHGSTVLVNGKTVFIAGGKGFGKSSLAANLIARGHQIVSDDISVISITDNCFKILSGIPVIKLWPQSLHLLSNALKSHSALYPGFEKQLCILKDEYFCTTKVELDVLIYLRRNTTTTNFTLIKKISDKLYLVSSSQYFVSYPHIYTHEETRISFKKIDNLVRQKNIYLLSCFNDLSQLDKACELIEKELT